MRPTISLPQKGEMQIALFVGLSLIAFRPPCVAFDDLPEPPRNLAPAESNDELAEFFRSKVTPIFEKHCYECHSHRSSAFEGGLALDWQSGWMKGGDRGPAIVPSKPQESLLIKAVRHSESDLKMPAEKLPAAEIEILEKWVTDGAWDDRKAQPSATDPREWWSLRPLLRPRIPDAVSLDQQNASNFSNLSTQPNQTNLSIASQANKQSNPIDAFVGAKLHEAKLEKSPRAKPRDLIRRVYYDLTGLPPSYQQVQAFEGDPSQQRYAAIVDELLASPRYGERWARHWFDTIHFAESHGYEHDVGRDHAWPYRDYYISSLNEDKDWATLVREQLAVDVLRPEASDLIPTLGFLGAGTFDLSTYSTGPVTFDYMDRDDMVNQTMAAFVSTTANCARCHAHKFDPISQEDYYALQAVFSGILKGDIRYDSNRSVAVERSMLTGLREAARKKEASALSHPLSEEFIAQWLSGHQQPAHWIDLSPTSFVSSDGATLTRSSDGIILVSGVNPDTDVYTLTGTVSLQQITAIRLEVLPHESLPMNGPGRCQNGNLHLSEVAITVFEPNTSSGRPLKIARATADFNQDGWGIERAIDGNAKTAWGIFPEVGKPHQAVFELQEPATVQAGSQLVITLRQLHGGSHLLGAFRVALTDSSTELTTILPHEIASALQISPDSRTTAQQQAIAFHAIADVASSRVARLPEQSIVYAVGTNVEIPTGNGKYQSASLQSPKPVHLLQRGEIDKPRDQIPPGALSALTHLDARFSNANMDQGRRRLALAEWLAHRDNVLTWRSIVNRVWHYHFGKGLCDTPSDFGHMGGIPSHPELIDYLAVWFRDDAAGSLKQLHKLIVLSQTYQQSSADNLAASQIDIGNRLMWRQNTQRLDADSFRDFVVAASGGPDLAMGGPSIQHFKQSPGPQATPNLDYESYDWNRPGSRRRSIYRYVWRGIPDPLMSTLDFPDLGLLAPNRSVSTSPLQSLALLNNPFVLHFSGQLAEQASKTSAPFDKQSPADGVQHQVCEIIRRVWLREPTPNELQPMVVHAEKHGVANLCRVLFNSSEFMYVQ